MAGAVGALVGLLLPALGRRPAAATPAAAMPAAREIPPWAVVPAKSCPWVHGVAVIRDGKPAVLDINADGTWVF